MGFVGAVIEDDSLLPAALFLAGRRAAIKCDLSAVIALGVPRMVRMVRGDAAARATGATAVMRAVHAAMA